MKALAVFPSSREVRLIDQPEPVIAGPTEVKLRILEGRDLRDRPGDYLVPLRHAAS